ncbi:hypothetical protein A2U01_0118324, partial [Trifolium medium]|nr:hypothetical protein [Trifolium medium]
HDLPTPELNSKVADVVQSLLEQLDEMEKTCP